MADRKTFATDLDLLVELQCVRLLEAERCAREAAGNRKVKEAAREAADKAVEIVMRDWENTLLGDGFDPKWLTPLSQDIAYCEAHLETATADLDLASSHEAARHRQVRLYSVLLESLKTEAQHKRSKVERQVSRRNEQDVLDIHQMTKGTEQT